MENDSAYIERFIKCYKLNPCLWDRNNTDYSNQIAREMAYAKLIDLNLEINPAASRETVIKKINCIRCSHQRELRKISLLKKLGQKKVFKPTLWYFHLLDFLREPSQSRISYAKECDKLLTKNAKAAIAAEVVDETYNSDGNEETSEDLPQMLNSSSIEKPETSTPLWHQPQESFKSLEGDSNSGDNSNPLEMESESEEKFENEHEEISIDDKFQVFFKNMDSISVFPKTKASQDSSRLDEVRTEELNKTTLNINSTFYDTAISVEPAKSNETVTTRSQRSPKKLKLDCTQSVDISITSNSVDTSKEIYGKTQTIVEDKQQDELSTHDVPSSVGTFQKPAIRLAAISHWDHTKGMKQSRPITESTLGNPIIAIGSKSRFDHTQESNLSTSSTELTLKKPTVRLTAIACTNKVNELKRPRLQIKSSLQEPTITSVSTTSNATSGILELHHALESSKSQNCESSEVTIRPESASDEPMETPDKIQKGPDNQDDSFDTFGRYLASLLRGVPRQKAFELQRKILDFVFSTIEKESEFCET